MKSLCAIAAISFGFFAHAAAHAAEAVPPPAADCAPAARYVRPEGVELPRQGEEPGVAPADLPGSRTQFEVPPVVKFDLALNPAGPKFNQSELRLGEVAIDRKTGETRIDGQLLGGGDPCALPPKKETPAQKVETEKPKEPPKP
jgi:hypothetical protein